MCPAPICMEDIAIDAIWRPGEEVCKSTPMNPAQNKQLEINRLFKAGTWKFRDEDDWFTYADLNGETKRCV